MVVPPTVRHHAKGLAGYSQAKAVVQNAIQIVLCRYGHESQVENPSAKFDAVLAS